MCVAGLFIFWITPSLGTAAIQLYGGYPTEKSDEICR